MKLLACLMAYRRQRSSSRASASYAPNLSSPSSRASLIYCAPSLSHSCSSVFVPDLKPLKLATLQCALGQVSASDSGLRVCQYEVPGGGVCRDKDCNDLHLSRLVSEPSGTYSLCFFNFELTDGLFVVNTSCIYSSH
ncbi:hypothetical protein BDR03DRAFT_656746 [Suillus americanus]|nr:hypothetical protein BDR03DRAFT_656746 [Suillus americanus]